MKTTIATLLMLAMLATTIPARAENTLAAATSHVDMGQVVAHATGVNPDDYPCAKAGILALYENREKISSLSALHPKRVFTWTLETLTYYSIKFVRFMKGFFTVETVKSGVRNVASVARSGNALGTMRYKVDGWVSGLNPRSRFVLRHRVDKLIEDSTHADGSCKS